MGIYNDKHRLFDDYEKELNSFREAGCEVSPSESNAKCEAYISSSECTWKNIFAPDTGELVGFLIYGKTGAFKHPDAERSMAEAYVAPAYRGKGLMSDVVKDYETRHKCIYSMLVQDKNEYAKSYWTKLFDEIGYKAVELDASKANTEGGLVLMGFGPKE